MLTIKNTKQERKVFRKGSILRISLIADKNSNTEQLYLEPPLSVNYDVSIWTSFCVLDTGTMGGVGVPTYRNRVVIFIFQEHHTTLYDIVVRVNLILYDYFFLGESALNKNWPFESSSYWQLGLVTYATVFHHGCTERSCGQKFKISVYLCMLSPWFDLCLIG